MRMTRELLKWIVDHASWDAATRLLESAKWKGVMSSVISLALGIWKWLHVRTWPETITIALASFLVVFLLLELVNMLKKRQTLPTVERFTDPRALNLIITNKYCENGLFGENLFVHSARRRNVGRRQWEANVLPECPCALTKDDHPPEVIGLKYGVPRMFQLVEFDEQPKPIIRWRTNTGEAKNMPLPDFGIWQLTAELRWTGGGMPKSKYWFIWDSENPLPVFCEEPH